ncbi:hypothetical protein R1sor_024982 [Riccia sorocarpa]|uniref:NB-ARC domain-containing protein n=1 Tax=Riccia sorocarpa TaxID=122646 RepID=A0ABD3GCX9_9MARC
MGGIGKSTLARLVFNQLNQEFEYSCFISDVKLKPGITLEEVLNAMHHYGERMNYNELTWRHLTGRKVLVVLDDVAKYEHLQILGVLASQLSSKGHRYIVTSRDVALLAEEFVERVVKLCNGLPLSLEVVGKYLRENKGKEKIWEKSVDALHNCVNIPNFKERLWDILQFSYDRLSGEAKEIFLDCASFFVGSSWRLREAKVAWQLLYSNFTDDFWESLVNTSLVYDVKDDDSMKMHEQMQDLGTKLAMCSGDGGNCSRTWNEKILSKALGTFSTEHWSGGRKSSSERSSSYGRSNAGRNSRKQKISVSHQLPECIEAVIALRLEEPMPITMEDISNMRVLRYLDSSKDLTPIPGKRIPPGVVLLRWRGQMASIADMFDPDEMNVLAVFHLEAPSLHEVPDSFGRLHQLPRTLGQLSKLQKLEICGTEVDELPTTMSNLYNLQQLGIMKNEKLRSLPNFWDLSLPGNPSCLLQLRHLLITECDQLDMLHTSLGHLQALRRLGISRCRRVGGLPDSVEHLSQLEHLELIECEEICSLPDNFGNLTSLETLHISLCSLRSLPDSFSKLSNLTKLSLLKCPLTNLPKEFGNLTRLETLTLRDGHVSILPDSLSSLGNLKELEISNCPDLTNLPRSFGTITSLTKLTLSNCGVSILPKSFRKLLKLDELVILSCPLNGLPNDFQKLAALRFLTLIEVPWTSVPTCIKFLPSLHTLTVKLPELTEQCEWLGQGLSMIRSYNRFCIRNGEFHLIEEEP